nr:hypothetical protein [Streptomyces tirandamycinicus]
MLDRVTRPVAATEPVDPDDFAAAARRPATVVTTTDEDLRGALESGDFGRWKSFLHPTQAKLVERRYNGPARVGGGPGTGKTVVACTGYATWSGDSPRGTTSRSCSPPTTRTSPPTCAPACWSWAVRNCSAGST